MKFLIQLTSIYGQHIHICQLTEPLVIMMNTRQQEKEGLMNYMEKFKQEKIILKSLIGENFLGSFVKIQLWNLGNLMKWVMQMK